MSKINASQIFIKDAKLRTKKLRIDDAEVVKLIDETKKKQAEVLKLKEVDQDKLRMVVQL